MDLYKKIKKIGKMKIRKQNKYLLKKNLIKYDETAQIKIVNGGTT